MQTEDDIRKSLEYHKQQATAGVSNPMTYNYHLGACKALSRVLGEVS